MRIYSSFLSRKILISFRVGWSRCGWVLLFGSGDVVCATNGLGGLFVCGEAACVYWVRDSIYVDYFRFLTFWLGSFGSIVVDDPKQMTRKHILLIFIQSISAHHSFLEKNPYWKRSQTQASARSSLLAGAVSTKP